MAGRLGGSHCKPPRPPISRSGFEVYPAMKGNFRPYCPPCHAGRGRASSFDTSRSFAVHWVVMPVWAPAVGTPQRNKGERNDCGDQHDRDEVPDPARRHRLITPPIPRAYCPRRDGSPYQRGTDLVESPKVSGIAWCWVPVTRSGCGFASVGSFVPLPVYFDPPSVEPEVHAYVLEVFMDCSAAELERDGIAEFLAGSGVGGREPVNAEPSAQQDENCHKP